MAIKYLKQVFFKQQFFPSPILGLFVNPFYFARSGLVRSMHVLSKELEGKLLDVGCGTKPYRSLFSNCDYVGLDIDSEHTRKLAIADFLYDGELFPFSDQTFDSILCNQVLEHVFNPDKFLSEMNRVCKPKAKLLLTVPFVWDEHEQPYDYARYSSFGLKHLLEKNNFKVIQAHKIGGDFSLIFQMVNSYMYKFICQMPSVVQLLLFLTFFSFFNVFGKILGYLLPKSNDLYLDNIILAEKNS